MLSVVAQPRGRVRPASRTFAVKLACLPALNGWLDNVTAIVNSRRTSYQEVRGDGMSVALTSFPWLSCGECEHSQFELQRGFVVVTSLGTTLNYD